MVLSHGGFLDFDDYSWTLKGSSLDPSLCPDIALQYTPEQIDDAQVKRIVNQLVRTNPRYVEVVKNKIFRKSDSKWDIPGFNEIKSTNSDEELAFLEYSMSKIGKYLEFGSGYSTTLALKQNGIEIISVESDPAYLERLQKFTSSLPKVSNSLEFLHADIGPTKEWGYPVDSIGKSVFLNYTNEIWKQLKIKKFKPDLIFIDGRFRVASFLMSLMEAPGAQIIFDDYMDRPEYQLVQDLLPLSFSVGRLGVFRVPLELSPDMRRKIETLLERYSMVPN